MRKIILDKWCTSQDYVVKHYCHVCGICIDEEEIQNIKGEQYFCSKHKGLNSPNVLLMDGRLFKTVFKYIEEILKYYVNELTFQVGRDGIRFRYMDPSHVSLRELHLFNRSFKVIKIDFPHPRTFTIKLDELGKILRKLERRNEILIRFNEDNIKLSFLGHKNALEKSFSLKLLNTQVENIPEPKLDLQVLLRIKASVLIQVLKKIKKMAHYENTYFECTSNYFQVYAYDDDNNRISESFSKSKLLKIWSESKVINVYDSDYILTAIDGLKQYIKIVQMQYSPNTPLLINANMNKTGHTWEHHRYLGHLRFYLAPHTPDM